jgi:hypothetical protein
MSEKRRFKSPIPLKKRMQPRGGFLRMWLHQAGGVRVKVPLKKGDLGGFRSTIEANKTFQTPSDVSARRQASRCGECPNFTLKI